MASFPRLFSPLTLNGVMVPNRIVSTAHATGYAVGGHPKERYRAY
jgi:2,4-dienoyl-CoA reductase-like NADH-dependent reductase (Old Yellow Enzyme family)